MTSDYARLLKQDFSDMTAAADAWQRVSREMENAFDRHRISQAINTVRFRMEQAQTDLRNAVRSAGGYWDENSQSLANQGKIIAGQEPTRELHAPSHM